MAIAALVGPRVFAATPEQVAAFLAMPPEEQAQLIGTASAEDRRAYLRALTERLATEVARREEAERQAAAAAVETRASRELSRRDALTGLYNRLGLVAVLHDIQQRRSPVAVIAIDIDHFKQVNDTYGHGGGDVVLQALADVLRTGTRDTPVRMGGEEFVVILEHTSPQQAEAVAERLRSMLEARTIALDGGRSVRVTASFGVAGIAAMESDVEFDAVLKAADQALYASKEAGRNRVTVASRFAVCEIISGANR